MIDSAKVFLLLLLPSVMMAVEYPALPSDKEYVLDKAGVISASYEESIEDLASEVFALTSVKMWVLTIPTTQGERVSSYAAGVVTSWHLDSTGNDLIMVVAADDRKVTTLVGERLRLILTESVIERSRKNILIPNFRDEEYGRGIYWTFREYARRIAKAYDVKLESLEEYPESNVEIPDYVMGECCAGCFRGACTAFWFSWWWDLLHHRHRHW